MRYFTTDQKLRLISFLIIVTILSVYISRSNIITAYSQPIFNNQTASIDIYGVDLALILNILAATLNVSIRLVSDMFNSISVLLISLLLLLPWKIIMVNRETIIPTNEYTVYKITHLSYIITNIAIGLVCAIISPSITILSIIIEAALMSTPYVLCAIIPTRNAHRRSFSDSMIIIN